MIFQDVDMFTCITAGKTCCMFNEILKDDIHNHYIEFSKKMIPKKFNELIECKMFAYFKNPNNTKQYKSVEEYDIEIEELSKQINENNYDDILETMKASYYDYVFEYDSSRGAESMMFGFMKDEYEKFIIDKLNYEINDTEEYNDYDDEF